MISRRLEEYAGHLLAYNDAIDKPGWEPLYAEFASRMGNLVAGMNKFERDRVEEMQLQLYKERLNPA